MRRKFLSVVLCVCMMLTMAPFAFAEEGTQTNNNLPTATDGVITLSSGTYTLSDNVTGSIVIPSDQTVILDLNKKIITNSKNGKATLSVAGTATVKNGTIQGGNSYYNVEVTTGGNLTLEGITATAGNTGSSMIDNWGTLTIESGTYTGGLNVVKNEPAANLTINGGEFELLSGTNSGYTGVIFNYGNLSITNGTFKQSETTSKYGYAQVIHTDKDAQSDINPSTKIQGGTFINSSSKSSAWTIHSTNNATPYTEVIGGQFNKKVTASYLPSGYGTVKNDQTGYYVLDKAITSVTLDRTNIRVKVGEKIKLNVINMSPEDAAIKAYSFRAKSGGKYVTVNSKTGDITGKAIGDAVVIAEPAGAGSIPAECTVHVYDEVAQIGDVKYGTIEEACEAVNSNETITLLKSTNVPSTISITNKSYTINLNGYTLTGKNGTTGRRVFMIGNSGGLTLIGKGTITTATKNTTKQGSEFLYNSSVISVDSQPTSEKGNASLVIGEDVTIKAPASNGISVFGCNDNSAKPTLVVNGTVSTTKDKDAAVIGNGSYGNLDITIGEKASLSSSKSYAIYFPVAGSLTINGGTIKGNGGIECKAGATEITVSGNPVITATGTPKHEINNNGSSTEGYAIAVVENENYSGSAKVSIGSGYFTGKLDIVSDDEVSADKKASLTITGGYFTENPSAYVISGKTALPGSYVMNGVTYNYKIGDPLPENVAVVPGKTEVKTSENMKPTDAAKIADSTISNVGDTANDVASKLAEGDKATKDKMQKILPIDAPSVGDSTVTTVVAPRLDIEVQSYDKESKTLTLDIEAVYDIKATTANNVSSMTELNAEKSNSNQVNTVTIKENAGKLDTTGTPVSVKLTLPDSFVNKGAKLYVVHTKSTGEKYVHAVTVQKDSNGGLYVEFVNDKGFSTFSISAVVAASITTEDGTTYYETLQDAVNAVQNGETIKLEKNCDETATVSRAVNFTLDTNGKTFTDNISAGSRYSLTKTNGEGTAINYTVTYVGGGSSSGTPTTSYNVNVNAATNGAVAADKKTASKGTTVTVTASPSKGYVVDAVKVVDKDGKDVAVTEKDGKYVFTMPASAVTVTGSFKAETPAPVALPFTDVKSGNWFYDAVKYAYAQGLMTGTSATTFAPNGTMNRAMIVTVLYRLEKSPAVTGASKFTDVPAGQWYSDAVAWAAANKIVNGYDETTFGPMNAVTREQMAAILFRYEQVKGLENVTLEENLNRFPDQDKISAYAIPALQWAVGQKIINGNADGTLDPTGTATRAQVAQIFTNLLNK